MLNKQILHKKRGRLLRKINKEVARLGDMVLDGIDWKKRPNTQDILVGTPLKKIK